MSDQFRGDGHVRRQRIDQARDRPGFEVDFLTRESASEDKHSHTVPSVLMPMRGHWRVEWNGSSATLAPGDTMSVPENLAHSAIPSMTR